MDVDSSLSVTGISEMRELPANSILSVQAQFGVSPTAEKFRQNIQNQYGDNADQVLELFSAKTDSMARQSQQYLSMLNTFGFQNCKWVQMQKQTGDSPIYLYHFTPDVPHRSEKQDFGAFHTCEVHYACNTIHSSGCSWEQTDRDLVEKMSSYLANIAKEGDPNGEGLTEWPAAKPGNYQTMCVPGMGAFGLQECKSIILRVKVPYGQE